MSRTSRSDTTEPALSRAQVLEGLDRGDVELVGTSDGERYLLVIKVDDDARSERRATFHATEDAARIAIRCVPPGWWPDCLIDLTAPIEVAVRDAAVGDGTLGDPYPFDADHVIFA